MAKQVNSLTDQLRQHMRDALESGESLRGMARAVGIDVASLSRFLHGRGVTVQTLDRLGRHLKLRLVKETRTKGR